MVKNLSRYEVIQAYLNSDLFVFASNVEYSPLVLYEAAAAGLPFLSVPVGNAEEIARWTGGGVVCPADIDALGYTRVDPRMLAEHMQALARNPDKLRALGDAGRRNWLERFTWDKITDQYEAIFKCLISQRDA
jgi:glycosyltransferase involved in cell wall biosynthesis